MRKCCRMVSDELFLCFSFYYKICLGYEGKKRLDINYKCFVFIFIHVVHSHVLQYLFFFFVPLEVAKVRHFETVHTWELGSGYSSTFLTGVRVFIEKKAQLTLLGTEMDFVESKLSSEFVFNNPNIKGTCGCGESFNIWASWSLCPPTAPLQLPPKPQSHPKRLRGWMLTGNMRKSLEM